MGSTRGMGPKTGGCSCPGTGLCAHPVVGKAPVFERCHLMHSGRGTEWAGRPDRIGERVSPPRNTAEHAWLFGGLTKC